MKQRLIKVGKIAGVVVLILTVCYFIFRNALLNVVIEHKVSSFENKYQCEIGIENPELTGLLTFNASKIWIKKNEAQDTLLRISNLKTELSFFKLLFGKIRVKKITANNLLLHFVKNVKGNNFPYPIASDSLPKQRTDTIKVSKKKSSNYAKLVSKIFNALFTNFPKQIEINQIITNCAIDNAKSVVIIPLLKVNEGDFLFNIYGFENNKQSAFKCIGNVDDSNDKLIINLSSLGKNSESKIPFLSVAFGASVGADTLSFAINKSDFSSDKSDISGYATAINLQINHPKISPEDVIVKKGIFNFSLHFTPTKMELDSSSSAVLNKLLLNTYFCYDNFNSKKINLDFGFKTTESQDFFESLPSGLFQNFEGIKTKGKLSYKLHFAVDLSNPDSVQFDSKLAKTNFKVVSFGKTNFAKLNGEYTHTAYEKDFAVKSFPVGFSYPYYTSINNISPYLKSALMTSEDGNFYYHSGFNEGAFKQSIATNIKEKRFARGGSTISMQLVKNVFLTRNKTVARKIEEALIVWLIESNRLVSKERMYEVYLNIIEWGPGVYGIGHASEFYFAKKPNDLTLEESIFLASIVPRPKAFKYSFDETANLKPHLEGYYKLLGNHLWAKGVINQAQKDNLLPKISLTGIAKNYVLKPDTINKIDTLAVPEFEY